MNFQLARQKLDSKLTNISEVSAGIVRGVRRNKDRDVAAYVFDLNNRLPKTVGDLNNYLDKVVGPAYFDNSVSSDLRWNNYLYFVVDRETAVSKAFQVTKRNVEADRNYARKFVVVEDDLERVLDELDSIADAGQSTAATDVIQTWSEMLSEVGMEDVLDAERPIADVVRSISSGTAKRTVRIKKVTGVQSSQQLVESHIASISLSDYRQYPVRNYYEKFGKANLLFGSNGVGKTSFLEGLEFLFCGANRRSASSSTAIVKAMLVSGLEVRTSAMQSLSDFKTRQRLWYGGDDNSRQNKLPNQFARFNFLNTDAAAELSLLKDGARDSNVESLAALLSGQEATLMWRRIQDVRKAVADDARSKRAQRAVAQTDKEGKEKELLVLERAPGQADAVFSIFEKDLEHIGWREVPKLKESVTEQLVGSLSGLASQLSSVHQLDWLIGQITESAVARQASLLNEACDKVKSELSALREDERALTGFTQKHRLVKSRLAALEAIHPEALAELRSLSMQLKQSKEELELNARTYATLPSCQSPDGWETLLAGKSLSIAYAEVNTELHKKKSQLEEFKKNFAASTRTQSELQRAMIELKNWAEKVVEHRHSDSNCPVCGTGFSPGELLQRMKELSKAPSESTISGLRQGIEHLEIEIQQLAGYASWFGMLDKFRRTLPESNSLLTVADIQKAVMRTIERQQVLLDTIKTAQKEVDSYSQNGLSLAAIEQLCIPLDENSGQGSTPQNVIEAIESNSKYILQLQETIVELESRVMQRDKKIKHSLNYAGFQVGDSLDSDVEQLMFRQRVVQRASEAISDTHRYVEISSDTDIRSFVTALEASVLGAQKVLAALQSDKSSATRLASLQEQILHLSERVVRVNEQIEQLERAQGVLDDIIENQSLDDANAAVVAATHKVADSIFGRIHAPAEYLVTADAETPLRRRDNNLPIQLNQVSTGQRAAYALSMFLAMNAQVKTGPKVLLLDDPISHIDDLNALSFLDYLRNLVIKSDRQVFFATADERIAGLFAHKFGFLGEDFQTIHLMR